MNMFATSLSSVSPGSKAFLVDVRVVTQPGAVNGNRDLPWVMYLDEELLVVDLDRMSLSRSDEAVLFALL